MLSIPNRFTCYTLFDISDKGNRSETRNWNTIIQVISLRTQPFIIKFPYAVTDSLSKYRFGEVYNEMETATVWSFQFEIEHDVFRAGDNPLANLITDTELVPLLDKHNIIHPPCCCVLEGPACNTYYVYND